MSVVCCCFTCVYIQMRLLIAVADVQHTNLSVNGIDCYCSSDSHSLPQFCIPTSEWSGCVRINKWIVCHLAMHHSLFVYQLVNMNQTTRSILAEKTFHKDNDTMQRMLASHFCFFVFNWIYLNDFYQPIRRPDLHNKISCFLHANSIFFSFLFLLYIWWACLCVLVIQTNLNDNRINTIIACMLHIARKFGIFLKFALSHSKNRTVNNVKFIIYDENHKCKHNLQFQAKQFMISNLSW